MKQAIIHRRASGSKRSSAGHALRAAIEGLESRRHLSMNVYLYGSYQEQGTEGGTIAFGVTAYDSNYWQVPDGTQHPSLTVGYSVTGATGDIESPPGTVEVTWEEGGPYGFGVIVIPIKRDNLVEGDEQITVNLTGGGDYTIGFPSWDPNPDPSPGSQTGVLHDDPPVVTVTAIDDSATEPPGLDEDGYEYAGPVDSGMFRISRSGGDLTAALSVSYTVGGTATSGTDYTALSGSVSIPGGSTFSEVSVDPKSDHVLEDAESVVLSVSGGGTNYQVGTSDTATVFIAKQSYGKLDYSQKDLFGASATKRLQVKVGQSIKFLSVLVLDNNGTTVPGTVEAGGTPPTGISGRLIYHGTGTYDVEFTAAATAPLGNCSFKVQLHEDTTKILWIYLEVVP